MIWKKMTLFKLLGLREQALDPRDPIETILSIISQVEGSDNASPVYGLLNGLTPEEKEIGNQVLAECYPMYVAHYYEEPDGDYMEWDNQYLTRYDNEYYRIVVNIASFIVNRAPFYAKKLEVLSEADTKGFLSQVGIATQGGTRYVDTPDGQSKLQNYFDDDSHATTTTATKGQTQSDFDTPMGRAREVLAYYPSIIDDFKDEFERNFAIYA